MTDTIGHQDLTSRDSAIAGASALVFVALQHLKDDNLEEAVSYLVHAANLIKTGALAGNESQEEPVGVDKGTGSDDREGVSDGPTDSPSAPDPDAW